MNETCVKYEEWGNSYILLLVSLLILWLVIGVGFISVSHTLCAVIFGGLFVSVAFSAFYLTCRHCYYYGKKCYLAIGLVVPHFFKKVEGPVSAWRATSWFIHALIVIAFPLVFIFQEYSMPQAVLYSIVYLVAPITAIVLVSRYSCPHCKHTSCISNPDRREAAEHPPV